MPSLQERAPLYQQYGLGAASTYSGTAQQNTSLLQKLMAGSYTPPAVITPSNAISSINQNVGYLNNLTSTAPIANQFNQNNQSLSQPTPQPSQPQGQQAPQGQQTSQSTPQGAPNQPQAPAPLSIQTNNQSLQNIINQANQIVQQFQSQGGTLDPQSQQMLNQINGLDANTQSLTVQANSALQNKEYGSFNDLMEQLKTNQKSRDTQIAEFYKSLQPLREQYLASLAPSQQETDLQTQLADLQKVQREFETSVTARTEEERAVPREYGISLGRISEVERRANTERKQRSDEEANLLTRLGLAQEARGMKTKGLEKGLEFAMQDMDFAQKMFTAQEEREQQFFQNAISLNTLQRNKLADILEIFKGSDPNKLSPDVQNQLAQLSSSIGIPYGMLHEGLQRAYDRELLDQKSKAVDIQKKQRELADLGVGLGGDSEYSGILNTILGSGKFTKDQTRMITNAIKNGEDPFTVVRNQAKNVMGQTLANDVTKYEVAKTQLQDVKSLLQQYYARGGQTSLLTGSYEKAINKLGEVSDPRLVEIATQIASALQIYRNAVSGTAYSVQEGKDIASIFPGINKSSGLNEAILKGRMSAFDSTIDGSYRSVLGSAYDRLKGVGAKSSTSQQNEDLSDDQLNQEYNSYSSGDDDWVSTLLKQFSIFGWSPF